MRRSALAALRTPPRLRGASTTTRIQPPRAHRRTPWYPPRAHRRGEVSATCGQSLSADGLANERLCLTTPTLLCTMHTGPPDPLWVGHRPDVPPRSPRKVVGESFIKAKQRCRRCVGDSRE